MFYYVVISGIIAGIISIILAISIIRTYISTKINAIIILFILFCLIGTNTITTVFLTFVSQDSELLAFWLYSFLIISGFFSLILICIFYDYIELGLLRTNTNFIFGILISAFFSFLFFSGKIPEQMGLSYSPEFSSWIINLDNYLRLIIAIFGILVIYRLFKGFVNIYRSSMSKRLKFQFKIINFGILFGLFGLFISSGFGIILSAKNFIIGSIIRASYSLFISIGLLIIFIGFQLNPYSIYLISQKVYQIIVFNKDGLTLFNQEFYASTSKQTTLITGAIFGVSSMIQHALGIETSPNTLRFADRIIIFEFKRNIGFALISDRDSQILRNGLDNFSNKFIETFENKLEKWDGTLKTFKNASEFIKNSFPFLEA